MKKIFKQSAVAVTATLLATTLTFAQDAAVAVSASAEVEQPKKSFLQSLKALFTRERNEAKETRMEIREARDDYMMNASGTPRGQVMMQVKQDAGDAGLTVRLQAGVKAGVITQAEADTVMANRKVIVAKEQENKKILDKLNNGKNEVRAEIKSDVQNRMMEKSSTYMKTNAEVKADAGVNASVNVNVQ
jgi:choline dehydrogenase-like flavoprotein